MSIGTIIGFITGIGLFIYAIIMGGASNPMVFIHPNSFLMVIGGTIAATFTLALTAATGQVTVTLTDVQTAALTSGRYVYDILLTDSSGDKTRILEGHATVTPSVSRS